MSVRTPTFSDRQSGLDTGASVLDGEILAEMAASLGRVGLALEKRCWTLKITIGPGWMITQSDQRWCLRQPTGRGHFLFNMNWLACLPRNN